MPLSHANHAAHQLQSTAIRAGEQAKQAGMSVTDYIEDLEEVARYALAKTNAIKGCPLHPDVTIRMGDSGAEHAAGTLAAAILAGDGERWMLEDLKSTIRDELDLAADGQCPECEGSREAQEFKRRAHRLGGS